MRLCWIDLETTGLDPNKDAILEIAVITTALERPFESIASIEAVLHYDGRELDPRVLDMHTKNGLLKEASSSVIHVGDIENFVLSLVPDVEDREDLTALAGSSVHFDLGFIRAQMPKLAKRLSHRVYDVSAVKLFCRSLGMPKPPKAEAHRAMADIRESIEHARACARWCGLPSRSQ